MYAIDNPLDIMVLNATHTCTRLVRQACARPKVEPGETHEGHDEKSVGAGFLFRNLARVGAWSHVTSGRGCDVMGGSAVLGGFGVED